MGEMESDDLMNDWQVRYEELAWGPEIAAAVLNRDTDWMTAALP